MVSANVYISTLILGHNDGCCQCLSLRRGFTSHWDVPRAYQVSLFSPKECVPFFLVILGWFPKWGNLCIGPLTARFFPLYVRYLFWGYSPLLLVASKARYYQTHVSVVLSPRDSYSGNALLFRSSASPEKDANLRIAPSWLQSAMALKVSFFSPERNFCLFNLCQGCLLFWGFFYLVFSSL